MMWSKFFMMPIPLILSSYRRCLHNMTIYMRYNAIFLAHFSKMPATLRYCLSLQRKLSTSWAFIMPVRVFCIRMLSCRVYTMGAVDLVRTAFLHKAKSHCASSSNVDATSSWKKSLLSSLWASHIRVISAIISTLRAWIFFVGLLYCG